MLASVEQFQGFSLSQEQWVAIRYLCSGENIRVLNGRAGTGKTTLLKIVADAYRRDGKRVLGASFQGKVVEVMRREIGIPSRTLDSLIISWERHSFYKNKIDQGKLWGRPYLTAVQKMKDYGRLFAERYGAIETKEVLRQRTDWQRLPSACLNDGKLLDGLKP